MTELNENILAVDCAEQLVGGPAVQLFSCVGIDVAHHKVDVSLGKVIKARTPATASGQHGKAVHAVRKAHSENPLDRPENK